LFLFLDYNLSETVAGLGFATFQLGSTLGRPIWCFISDSLLAYNKSKAFLFLGFLFTFVTFTFSILLKNFATPPLSVLFLLTFLAGFSGNGWPGLYTASVTEVVEEDNVGIAIGLSLLFARFGLMIAPPIFGYIADLRGSYNLSWFLLGTIILVTSLIQYLFSPKKKEVPG
nr:MFS transporter [Atribacterota bacterium]